MIDPTVVFSTAAAIILIGFAADQLFKKTGVPSFLFLIFAGILLGPVTGLISPALLVPILGTLAELTLVMVLFYGGMDIGLKTLLSNGARIMTQIIIYVFVSALLIAAFVNFALGWGWPQSLIFGAILGGEITAAVMVPLSRALKLRDQTKTFLTLESALTAIFSVILFISFVGLYQTGSSNVLSAVSSIVSEFSIGILSGLVLSIIWILILNRIKTYKYTYVFTVGLILLTYSISTIIGGSGLLAALIFGIVLGNNSFISRMIKKPVQMDLLEKRLADFQGEISFLLETFFFVFLGLIFSITLNNLLFGLVVGGIITGILLSVRTIATSISTFRSVMSKDRTTIILLCALGVTPATLAILALSDGIPLANTFLNLITYVIIFTNVITTIGAYLHVRASRQKLPDMETN